MGFFAWLRGRSGKTQRGVCIRWSRARGFGFLRPDAGGPEVFAHYGDILSGDPHRDLVPGACYTFEIVTTTKGIRARNIRAEAD